MESLVNNLKSTALSVGEMITPILKESKFHETGVLTPEEFVLAGDHLVHHCPTWQWVKASDPSRMRSYLPADKQFLITRNVPCRKRCRDLMNYDSKLEKMLTSTEAGSAEGFEGDEDSGWVDTHHYAQETKHDGVDLEGKAPVSTEEEDEDAVLDLDDLVESGALEDADPNRFVVSSSSCVRGEVEKTRTYDLHITYDKYYQVPRVWLCGYDEERKPLTTDQMNEDMSADHANKTITMESHPHIDAPPMASVHPCRHAETMKRLSDQLADSGKEQTVHQYLFLFLKFVQAVVPTIDYDHTRSVQL